MAHCLIGIGSNLGDREDVIERTLRGLESHPGFRIVARSRWRETPPAGGPPGQRAFLNGAVLCETIMSPHAVLDALQRLEDEMGRRRDCRWGPRSIDLDLLLYDRLVIDSPSLALPHPRMAWRRFVLEPAAEVAPEMLHPTTAWTIARLLDHLNTSPRYVAITGPVGAGKTALASRVVRETSGRLIAEEIDPERLGAFYADPSGSAWATELEFLQQRARLLAVDRPEWIAAKTFALSDFWFDQSLAFARVWLRPHQFDGFRARFEAARRTVVRPRVTVLVDAPTEELLRRIRDRGRSGEDRLTAEALGRIRLSLQSEVSQPDRGPVLRLTNVDADAAVAEVCAAIQAMA